VGRDQLEVRLREIVGMSIDGEWNGHDRISSLVNAATRIVYPKCLGDLSAQAAMRIIGFLLTCPRVRTDRPA